MKEISLTKINRVLLLIPTLWEAKIFIKNFRMTRIHGRLYERSYESIRFSLLVSGVGMKQSKKSITSMLIHDFDTVLLLGFSGALNEHFCIGDVIIDPDSNSFLLNIFESRLRLYPIRKGKFLTVAYALSAKQKINISKKSNCISVDMETQVISEVCRENKIPFFPIRVISDTLRQNIPDDIFKYLNINGELKFYSIFKNIFRIKKIWIFMKFFSRFSFLENRLSMVAIHVIHAIVAHDKEGRLIL